jgi:hypothetical protein
MSIGDRIKNFFKKLYSEVKEVVDIIIDPIIWRFGPWVSITVKIYHKVYGWIKKVIIYNELRGSIHSYH